MFGLFHKRKVAGDIAGMGLQDWWFGTFSESDREWMANAYAPLGGRARVLVEGARIHAKDSFFRYLSGVAPWMNKEGHRHCAIAFADKAMEFYADDLPVLDRHFGLATRCEVYYRWREVEAGAFDKAIAACEMCIGIHEEAAREFLRQMNMVPAHACFKQLRIIEEKRENYARAIELCEMAKSGGWSGGWDEDIARIRKKIAKAS